MNKVENYMISVQKLSGNLSPNEAIAQLPEGYYGVVEDERSNPIAVIAADDLKRAAKQNVSSLLALQSTAQPTLIVGSAVEMQDVEDSPLFETLVQETGGALVLDDSETIVGFLHPEKIRQYMMFRGSLTGGATLGSESPYISATGLAGSRVPLRVLRICAECFYPNKFSAEQCQRLEQQLASGVQLTEPCQNNKEQSHFFRPL